MTISKKPTTHSGEIKHGQLAEATLYNHTTGEFIPFTFDHLVRKFRNYQTHGLEDPDMLFPAFKKQVIAEYLASQGPDEPTQNPNT